MTPFFGSMVVLLVFNVIISIVLKSKEPRIGLHAP